MDQKRLIKSLNHNKDRMFTTLRWIVFSFIVGVVLGIIGAIFYHGIKGVTAYRLEHPWVLALLPIGAVLIRLMYHLANYDNDGGTNLVLSAIHSDDNIPKRMSGLIFISTIFSHFVGASVGREGAALQLGGSIGNSVGKLFRFNDTDKKTMIMVGMSAVFSALFGTPMAAAIFSMEVVSVGIMHYAALLPCVIASFVARGVAIYLGAPNASYTIEAIPSFGLGSGLETAFLAILCGLVSILFCASLHQSDKLAKKYLKNPYLRALIGGSIALVLTLLVGDQSYNGAGVDYIIDCMDGETDTFAFLIKILFTVICITAGYKGGEIVPSFFIGASFGCMFGSMIGFAPSLCAAIGMGAVFCGVTNSPITSFIICLELFGMDAAPYFLLAIALSYMVSGYYGLYSSQKIVYSKYKSNYINTQTK
ncbi:MAG: chloride channel protein [Lachnospiraceae bacterium]|nr:chloride channel protein [Lachnospiraceae bacterium]